MKQHDETGSTQTFRWGHLVHFDFVKQNNSKFICWSSPRIRKCPLCWGCWRRTGSTAGPRCSPSRCRVTSAAPWSLLLSARLLSKRKMLKDCHMGFYFLTKGCHRSTWKKKSWLFSTKFLNRFQNIIKT